MFPAETTDLRVPPVKLISDGESRDTFYLSDIAVPFDCRLSSGIRLRLIIMSFSERFESIGIANKPSSASLCYLDFTGVVDEWYYTWTHRIQDNGAFPFLHLVRSAPETAYTTYQGLAFRRWIRPRPATNRSTQQQVDAVPSLVEGSLPIVPQPCSPSDERRCPWRKTKSLCSAGHGSLEPVGCHGEDGGREASIRPR
jgi:hypothetical protein